MSTQKKEPRTWKAFDYCGMAVCWLAAIYPFYHLFISYGGSSVLAKIGAGALAAMLAVPWSYFAWGCLTEAVIWIFSRASHSPDRQA